MLQQSFGAAQPLLETLRLPRHSDAQRAALLQKLRDHNIPVETRWGTGSAKGLDHLLNELHERECTLISAGGRTLLREFRVARVDVYHYDESGQLLQLKEARQEFTDGRSRCRGFEYAIGEKAKPQESPFVTAHRGLREELKVQGRFDLVPLKSFVELEPPSDFPGIPSITRRADYRLVLPREFYRSEGYVDEQTDKTTFFIWIPSPVQKLPEPKVNALLSF